MTISILLYFSSFDEIYAVHEIGYDIIHVNLYDLKLESSPPGLQIDGAGTYEENTWVVTGVAQQNWGAYEFVSWKIDGNWVDGNPVTLLMDDDRVVTAVYAIHPVKKQDSVNFKESNNANTFDLFIISPYGKTTGSGSYSENEIVEFNVSEQYVYDEIHDGVRYAFSGWTDGNTPNLMSNFIKMDDMSTTITANWLKQYRLEIFDSAQKKNIISTNWLAVNSTAPLVMSNFEPQTNGQIKRTINEWISVGPNHAKIENSKIPITSVRMENPYAISIDWKNQFYLDVKSKYGKVAGSGFYDEGDVVVASINSDIQNSGFVGTRLMFDGWEGDENSKGANVQVIIDKPKSLEGVWKKQFQLTVNSEYGISSGTGWYNEGEVATFGTNIPRDPAGLWQQNTFQGWSGDIDTKSNTGSILMNGPKTVIAKWDVDYFIAFLNIGLISSMAIGGFFVYKKMKKGSKPEKLVETEVIESLPTKIKKQLQSGLTKEISTKTNSKIDFSDNQITTQNNKLEQILDNTEQEKVSQEKEQLERRIAEVEHQRNDLFQKTEQLEKSIREAEIAKKKIAIELENDLAKIELEEKKTRIKLENELAEIELEKNNVSQKTEQLEKNITEVEHQKKKSVAEFEEKEIKIKFVKKNLEHKTDQLERNLSKIEFQEKNLDTKTEELETKLTKIDLEKKKLSFELERKESAVELKEKRINQKAWDLEKRIGKFTLEMNISAVELEKKRIAAELERKELVIELEEEHLSERKKELEKSIAAIEIEKDIAPMEIQKNIKLNKENISPELKDLKNVIAEIELARKISTVELGRKESVIELEKKKLATKTDTLEKRMFGIETERKISAVQLEKIEAEIELEKKKLEQTTREFGKNTASKNTDLIKNDWNYSYSVLDSEHNSYEKFRQWANVLENELAIKETSDKENRQDMYPDDGQ